jgi:hypothetical protein
MTDEENKPTEQTEEAVSQPEQPQTQEPQVSSDSKMMAMLCHLLAIFTGFIAPLIIWLIKKDEDEFVNDQGKESLNWQILMLIGYIIGVITSPICIGVPILIAVPILSLIFCIIASIKANSGEKYRYPQPFRLIK